MSDRAWTSGPWLYRPKSGSWHVASDTHPYGLPFITTPDSCDMEFANDSDADLIALAPEMAEAILFCDTLPIMPNALKPVIEKLRAIGGSDD